ncbi:Uncharacterized conserved protein [Phaffia rhodozyma]|uniref:Uncharacterized conserved protein n=1 Tax=Phaffia rhodozyma TaxID=264483 RepID=A0A0F7SP42_PHARH|nr:Uncharacterized conserved protein [Phaffia rhodozyma]
MKIYALPLARKAGSKPLVYFYTSLPPPSSTAPTHSNPHPDKHPLRLKIEQKLDLLPSAPLPLQLTAKATAFWMDFGKPDAASWKQKIHKLGERWMDKIDFEEWSLKSVEHGLVPADLLGEGEESHGKIKAALKGVPEKGKDGEQEGVIRTQNARKQSVIELLYPESPKIDTLDTFEDFLKSRQPFHDKMFKRTLALVPAALAFGILPIVPNFPLFYVGWRAWSHWRARNASALLLNLLDKDRIKPTESKVLTALYESSSFGKKTKSKENGKQEDRQVERFLTEKGVEELVGQEKLGDAAKEEILRAVHQTAIRLPKSNQEQSPTPESHKEKTD